MEHVCGVQIPNYPRRACTTAQARCRQGSLAVPFERPFFGQSHMDPKKHSGLLLPNENMLGPIDLRTPETQIWTRVGSGKPVTRHSASRGIWSCQAKFGGREVRTRRIMHVLPHPSLHKPRSGINHLVLLGSECRPPRSYPTTDVCDKAALPSAHVARNPPPPNIPRRAAQRQLARGRAHG